MFLIQKQEIVLILNLKINSMRVKYKGNLKGEEYIVAGILFNDNEEEEVQYFLFMEQNGRVISDFHIVQSSIIEITDNRVSKYWSLGKYNFKKDIPILIFQEFFKEQDFYLNLIEGGEKEKNILEKYYYLIKYEYPENFILK